MMLQHGICIATRFHFSTRNMGRPRQSVEIPRERALDIVSLDLKYSLLHRKRSPYSMSSSIDE